MDRIGYETTQTVHYFQIDGSRSMTPAALLSALQEMAISHSDSLGFSVQYKFRPKKSRYKGKSAAEAEMNRL